MTDTAKSDLREIALGILEVSRELDTAVNFVTELEEQCKILNTLPESGSVPKDYVLATNETHTVRQFVEAAFGELGISIRWEGEGVNEKGYDAESGRLLVRHRGGHGRHQ